MNLQFDYDIPSYNKKEVIDDEEIARRSILKAKFIYDTKEELTLKIENEGITSLFYNIEMPIANILAKMEIQGITVKKEVLEEMGEEIKIKLELITKDIYNYAGCEFNINSPKQLGEVLFDKLKLPKEQSWVCY